MILSVNGKPINNSRELARTIAGLSPGSTAQLHIVRRNGDERDVGVKLGEFPSNDKVAALSGGGGDSGSGKELEDLGLTLIPAPELPGSKAKEGVAVSSVDPNSRAADQGLKRGDIIVEVNGKTVSSPDDVVDSIKDAREKGRKNVLLQVRSRDQQRFLALPIEGKQANSGQDSDDQSKRRQR